MAQTTSHVLNIQGHLVAGQGTPAGTVILCEHRETNFHAIRSALWEWADTQAIFWCKLFFFKFLTASDFFAE